MNNHQSAASPLEGIELTGDDAVVPFQVDALNVRGRTVQLGPMLNAILERHNYPPLVSALLAEVITLTVLLGTSLKFEGKFTVQTQTDGPVSLLVVDFSTPGSVRAYARHDEKLLQQYSKEGRTKPQDLMGKGILAMTVDQGPKMQRYQGIVELDGASLEHIAHEYFRQSEQIPTVVRLAAAEIYTPMEDGSGSTHQWRGGGLMVQFLPFPPEETHTAEIPASDDPDNENAQALSNEEAWTEARALTATISDDELTDPQINAERLLLRLFHQRGVRVYEGMDVVDRCTCSRERFVDVIRGLNPDDVAAALEKSEIETTCEFCNKTYRISEDELK